MSFNLIPGPQFVLLPEAIEGELIGSYTSGINSQIAVGVGIHLDDAINHYQLATKFLANNDLVNWAFNRFSGDFNVAAAVYEMYRITDENLKVSTWQSITTQLNPYNPFFVIEL